MSGDRFVYQGRELDVFACAERWKRYWAGKLRRWIRGDVLEVGAGLGANTPILQNADVRSWHCIEPDPVLAERLARQVSALPRCSVFAETIADRAGSLYDTVLYIDVLEHIEADAEELAAAATLLRPGGHLIVLSPAHQFLFTEFDAAIGHYRRYNKASLRACSPPGCALTAMFYLDSAGILASLANRAVLRQSAPTVRQIQTWDRLIIPVSRLLDLLLGHRLGKTVIGVWTRLPGPYPVSEIR